MKNLLKPTNLPVLAAAFGGIALVLRRVLYAVAVDQKNLLPLGHPLEWLLLLFSGAVLLFLWLQVRQLDGSDCYADNFSASKAAMLGHFAAAAGVALTMLINEPRMPGYLGTGWMWLGWLSPVCLILAGLDRRKGKLPFFGLHLVPCLFLVLHIVNHYQMWSGNPQFQDYVFALFGTMALMFFAFYCAAFGAETGNRRMQLVMGLAAVFLLTAELSGSQYPWLYLGGIAWVLTDLCSLTPVPKPEESQEKET